MFVFLVASSWARFRSAHPGLYVAVHHSGDDGAGAREFHKTALANGFYMALSFLIRSLTVLLLGWLGDLFGLRLAFMVSAVVPLLGLPTAAPARQAHTTGSSLTPDWEGLHG
jgi:MFS family permease